MTEGRIIGVNVDENKSCFANAKEFAAVIRKYNEAVEDFGGAHDSAEELDYDAKQVSLYRQKAGEMLFDLFNNGIINITFLK